MYSQQIEIERFFYASEFLVLNLRVTIRNYNSKPQLRTTIQNSSNERYAFNLSLIFSNALRMLSLEDSEATLVNS